VADLPDAPWATKELPDAPWVKAPAKSSSVGDFFKSIPRGIMGGLSEAGSALGQATMHEMGQPENAAEIPNAEQTTQHLERNVTGEMHRPEGRPGKFGAAIGGTLGNPASYVGPGGPLLKIGGAALSATGSEAAGQVTEGTAAEPYARIAGALMGGVAGAKALGPTVERAAVPTAAELKTAGVSGGKFGGYEGAAKSGLELDPAGVASWAGGVEQKLYGKRFSGGTNGTAPKTFAALEDLAQPPAAAGARTFVGPTNIDALRAKLQDISKEVQPTQGGAFVATKDAAAASQALEHLATYTENIPAGHVLAGDASAYVRATKEANANYGAGARTGDFDARLTKAERATDRQIAGSLDAQIKTKAGQMIDRGTRGLNAQEKAQLELIERGGPVSNTLRQLGRGGAGVIPMAAHAATALATGGGSIPLQLGIGIPLYAARKISEGITKSRAAQLAEMLAQRSPEYERRVSALPTVDTSPNKAAIVRALLGVH
jgi:hypothetical protein